MPADLYDDGGPVSVKPENTSAAAPKDKGKEDTGETFLVAKSVCPGMKVGDTLQATIVAEHDQEYEMEYVKPGEEKAEGEGEPPAEGGQPAMAGAPEAGGGMGGMYE